MDRQSIIFYGSLYVKFYYLLGSHAIILDSNFKLFDISIIYIYI